MKKRKFLSVLLVLAMTLSLLPTAALAADGCDVEGLTGGIAVTGSGELTVTVQTETPGILTWYEKNDSIGRYQDGWWVGVKITAPSDLTNLTSENDVNYRSRAYYDGYEAGATWSATKSLYTNQDSAKDNPTQNYMGVWLPVSQDSLKYGIKIVWEYQFDWDRDGNYEQLIKIVVDPAHVILMKNGVQVYPANAAAHEAKIGNIGYETLAAAIAAVPSSGTQPTVITLLRDVENAPGISVEGGKNFIVDFADHTYTLNKPGAGSTSTETNGFQLLKGSTIVFKNGTINISESNLTPAESGKNIKRIIQNYANLTLENMTIDGTNQYGGATYVMSFNNDPVSITGTTSIIAAEGKVAFDADGNWGGYKRCAVTVNTTGTITGNIEVGQGSLNIENADVKGGIVLCTSCGESETTGQAGRISVTGGTFSVDPADYVSSGYHTAETAGKYGVHAITLEHHDAVPASCTVDGTEEYWMCEECGKLYADDAASVEIDAPGSIPATGHTAVTDNAVPATCTTTGLTEGSHCSVCGTVLVAQTVIPAAGHSFGDWTVTKEPTTTEAGSKTRECSVCHVEETVTIPALGVTTFTITPSVTNGTITPSEAVDVEEGGSQRFDFAPNSGYELGSVKVDGSDVDADSYYIFANVTANHTIVVAFTAKAPDTIPVESVTLNMTNMTLHSIGASNTTMPLTVTVTPANATDKTVTFSSSNETVATVNQDGYVTAVGAGTAIITATVGGKTATCTVTVELKPAESHTIVTDTFTLDFGDAVVEEMTIPLGNALEAEETEVKVVRLGYGAAFTFTSRMTRRNWITYAELYQRSPGEAGYYKCTGVWDDESTVATEQNKPYTITFPSRQQIEDTFKSLDEYEIDLSDAEILYHYAVMEENAESWELDPDVVGEFFVILTDEDTPEPQKATVTFNSNGGSAVASQTVTVGGTAQKPADPTRTGYTFAGWYTDEACTMAYTFGEPVTADLTLYAKWTKNSTTGGGGGGSSSGGSSSGGSSSSSETTKNPDGSTTTTTTDKTTGTVTEVTKETDGSTTTVETKKDGTVTETVETANGTTGTVVADKNGNVTEVSASVSAAAADDAAKTGAAVTLPVEVPVTKTTEAAPAVEVSVPKSSGSVKVEIPVENVTAGTVAVIVKADGTEEIVKTSVTTENGVALTLDGSATVKIIDNSKEFDDVQSVNHWAQDSIDFVTSRELFNGTSTTTFSPNEPTTRAQLMTVLARLDGADTTGAALEKGMSWAVEKGVSDGSNPNGTISRQQLAVMLYRYAGSPATQQTLDYPDADKVDGYAEAAMKWAVENGIVGGMDDGTLNPQGPATRAQVAAMMARFCTKLA